MWKVSNDINSLILNRYSTWISSFFKLMIEHSRIPEVNLEIEKNELLERKFDSNSHLSRRLLTVNKSSTNRFKPVVKSIVELGASRLEEEFKIYTEQNKVVSERKYNLIPREHPEPLRAIFKDYFYDKFFGVGWIWTDLLEVNYSREVFKTNFKEENRLYVCSYCDIDTISSTRNAWIEHFLPKSKFPYLACNPNNLIPSCTSCNVSGSGKGEDIKNPVATQYQFQIGEKIVFEFYKGMIVIKKHDDLSVENYIELLKLRKRYQETSVHESVLSMLETNYDIFNTLRRSNQLDKGLFDRYIRDLGRVRGFYFVQNGLVEYKDEIFRGRSNGE